jgi:nitrate reductase gamma subunit
VTPEFKQRTGIYAGAAFLAALLTMLCLWGFSKAHTPLAYMVWGTLATAILLAGAFVLVVKRGFLGRPRRAQTNPDKRMQTR